LFSKVPNRIRISPTKLGEPGIREGGEAHDQEQRGQHGRTKGHAAQLAELLAAAGACGDHAHDQEQRHHHEAVVDHLHDGTLGALFPQGRRSERG